MNRPNHHCRSCGGALKGHGHSSKVCRPCYAPPTTARLALKRRALRVVALSHILGLSIPTIYRALSGRPMSRPTALAIGGALGIDPGIIEAGEAQTNRSEGEP